jgi:predicted house-cleaning noncanonical NTP pyrophosphatase (MazG superfamily)
MKTIKFKVEKLIRDGMPEMMRSQKIDVFERVMSDDEFLEKLKTKLLEESVEVQQAKNKNELIEELADVLEVINAMCKVNNIEFREIEESRIAKRSKRGGFDNKIFNSRVEIKEDNPIIKYYKDRPNQYPEIK